MSQPVEISFDCLPLRTVGRFDVPIDASPKFRAKCERILTALEKHGAHNSYFLHNAACAFRLTNHPDVGLIQFQFEGTLLTNDQDDRAKSVDLRVELVRETCDWLTEPIVAWFRETVERAVMVEFDRYIEAGDLAQAIERIQKLQAASDQKEGFMGMYL